MRKKDSTNAERERARQVAEDLETIREVYESRGGVARPHRHRLSLSINQAADLVGVRHKARTYPERYELAERALRGQSQYGAIRQVHYYCERIRAVWQRPAGVTPEEAERAFTGRPAPKAAESKPAARTLLYTLSIVGDCVENLGLVDGDHASVYAAGDFKPGDAAAITMRGNEDPTCGRVVSLDAETITLRDNYEDFPLRRAEIVEAGRIDLVNVKPKDPLTPAERRRADELRERLAGIDRDDVTNSTAAMKLERELFDLEHPKDVDDWSAWEEGDED